eukprot:11225909-Lingulodinium_polyedra.AAC.1
MSCLRCARAVAALCPCRVHVASAVHPCDRRVVSMRCPNCVRDAPRLCAGRLHACARVGSMLLPCGCHAVF